MSRLISFLLPASILRVLAPGDWWLLWCFPYEINRCCRLDWKSLVKIVGEIRSFDFFLSFLDYKRKSFRIENRILNEKCDKSNNCGASLKKFSLPFLFYKFTNIGGNNLRWIIPHNSIGERKFSFRLVSSRHREDRLSKCRCITNTAKRDATPSEIKVFAIKCKYGKMADWRG